MFKGFPIGYDLNLRLVNLSRRFVTWVVETSGWFGKGPEKLRPFKFLPRNSENNWDEGCQPGVMESVFIGQKKLSKK